MHSKAGLTPTLALPRGRRQVYGTMRLRLPATGEGIATYSARRRGKVSEGMSQTPVLSLTHKIRIPDGQGPHPTVMALHGRGSQEDDLIGLADYLDPRLLWLSPRAPLPQMGGYEWYRLRD